MNRTAIEWCDATWNPIVGCTHGCPWCYARRFAQRSRCPDCKAFWPHLHPERLTQVTPRQKPKRVFVGSMCDLFDPLVTRSMTDAVFDAMRRAPQHTYILLTKQPHYMAAHFGDTVCGYRPAPNWWLGVSVTNQADADERVPELLQIPAAVRFVSIEPLLAPVDVTHGLRGYPTGRFRTHEHRRQFEVRADGLDWAIVGAQTGPGARPPEAAWVQSIIDPCRAAGVPLFINDNVVWGDEVREFPEAKP